MFKKIFSIFLIFFFIFSQQIFAEENKSKKILIYSKDIWLSKDLFFDGEKIRIYSKFRNDNNFDIKQKIEFLDNKNTIGNKIIEIAKKSSIIVWIDTNLSYGEHDLIAKPIETMKSNIGNEEKINTKIIANLKKIRVDKDTDKDGIGDEKDIDDDNDGISDTEEIKAGSNPKSKLSTPNSEKVKKTVTKAGEKTKNIVETLIASLSEKRESLKKSIDKELKKNSTIQNNSNSKIEKKPEEEKVINKHIKKNNFQNKKEEFKKILKDKKNTEEIRKTVKKEESIINKKTNIKTEEKEFLKACLYQAKYEKIQEIIKKKNSTGFWSNFWYILLLILSFIFKNNFLTILFFIFIFWLLWKIVKRF